MVGLLWAAAAILGAAGLSKLAQPASTVHALKAARIPRPRVLAPTAMVRVAGATELAVAGYVLGWGGSPAAALLAVCYLILTVVAWRMLRVSPGQDCGCFGGSSEPITRWHLLVDIAGLSIGVAATRWPQPSVLDEVTDQGAQGVLLVGLSLLLAWLCYLLMTALPALGNLRAKVADR
ncbi:MAG TPA: MauE/DoxX family redox-associated membrane protein [Nakamurella sp.]|nr:MauE/DoxX family redox-associated membrane protein [Nakamurella sp.]